MFVLVPVLVYVYYVFQRDGVLCVSFSYDPYRSCIVAPLAHMTSRRCWQADNSCVSFAPARFRG